MYYLIDLTNQSQKTFETKTDLLAHWRFRLRHESWYFAPLLDFRDLNITGRDMFSAEGVSPRLRRFQVLDNEGRSQDIRTWTEEIKVVNSMPSFPHRRQAPSQARFRIDPADAGSKMPMRKGRCGAFIKQRLRDAEGVIEFDYEDDLLGFTPVRDNAAPRTRSRLCRSDGRTLRSWKEHTKNTSQWGRHSERAAETPIRKRPFDQELDIEKLALELCVQN